MPYPKQELIHHPESGSTFWGTYNQQDANGGALIFNTAHLRAGQQVECGAGWSRTMPDMDFETYSEAGYYFDPTGGRSGIGKWCKVEGAPTQASNGLEIVGAPCYSEHPSTELLSLAYDLKDGLGKRLWVPGCPEPIELFEYITSGGLIEAWNSSFEYYIWLNVCQGRMGWPQLPFTQLRDAMAKALAFSLPGGLEKACVVLNTSHQKISDGKRLLDKFSKPRNPTKPDRRLRIKPSEDPVDGPKLYEYNLGDIEAEADTSARCPDLSPEELKMWLLDQYINFRGVAVDVASIQKCRELVRTVLEDGNREVVELTEGRVTSIGQRDKILSQLLDWGVPMPDMKQDTVTDMLEECRADMQSSPRAIRLLELRSLLGSASVKKLNSLDLRKSWDGRIRGLFQYCGADRTGRWAGRGPQPQNLPASGPDVKRCDPINGCGKHFRKELEACPWCSAPGWATGPVEWCPDAANDALWLINNHPAHLGHVMGDTVEVVGACLRAMFVAGDGYDLICSDYSAIEAVVLAALAGEEWRMEVFRGHGKIYEMSASKISGVPFEEFMEHKRTTGDHHPLRKKLGKVAELAGGYQGGLGAWKAFGASEFMNDEEIKLRVKAWRAENPAIVKYWYGVEDAARSAIQNPRQCFGYRGVTFGMKGDVLFCQLLSGRKLSYHRPRLVPDRTPWGKEVLKITYEGRDTYTGAWVRLDTYGGKLTENIVQATARDILAHALCNVHAAGYTPVLHVHDEIVAEVRKGEGSIEHFEALMGQLPDWCSDWPVRAAGGWRGHRFRKD